MNQLVFKHSSRRVLRKGLNHEVGVVGWRDEMSIGVTDRIVTGWQWQMWLAGDISIGWDRALRSSAGCRRRRQVGGESGTLDAWIARATEVADGLDIAEDLFDELAYSLADCVARLIGGAQV